MRTFDDGRRSKPSSSFQRPGKPNHSNQSSRTNVPPSTYQHSKAVIQNYSVVSRRRCLLLGLILLFITILSFSSNVSFTLWRSKTVIYPGEDGHVTTAWWNSEITDSSRLTDESLFLSEEEPDDSTLINGKFKSHETEKISDLYKAFTEEKKHANPQLNSDLSSLIHEVLPSDSSLDPLPTFEPNPMVKYENVTPFNSDLSKLPSDTRFLSYLPHSGFHNQRIELLNAFLLSKLLNRTLFIPEFRLGRAIGWNSFGKLSKTLGREMKNWNYDCMDQNSLDQNRKSSSTECTEYKEWSSVQAQYVLNLKSVVEEQPVVHQQDMRHESLREALKLTSGEWYEVRDITRYSYQIYESRFTESVKGQKYDHRIDLEDLRPYEGVKLLSFGSLFGSDRIIIQSPELQSWKKKLESNQLFNLPILETVSEKVVEMLGGRRNYIGIHLRLRNEIFASKASSTVIKIFREVCKDLLKLQEETIEILIEKQKKREGQRGKEDSYGFKKEIEVDSKDTQTQRSESNDEGEVNTSESGAEVEVSLLEVSSITQKVGGERRKVSDRLDSDHHHPSNRSKCNRRLYNNPLLQHLNVPIYIASDIIELKSDHRVSILYNTFPCIFTSSDFTKIIESSFGKVVSSNDGLELQPFLLPMLETVIASKGSGFVGTPGSTLSSYAASVLHPFYSQISSEA